MGLRHLPRGVSRRVRPVALLALLLIQPALAEDDLLGQGHRAIAAGQPQQALALFNRAADQGDPAGLYGLGVLYYDGIGVTQDRRRSAQLFRKAAEADYPPAQYNLGNAYLRGDGVDVNPQRARHWLQRAVDTGFDQARYNLANLLSSNRPTPWKRELAIAHFRYLAERGMLDAMEELLERGEPLAYTDIVLDPTREPLRSEARIAVQPAQAHTIQLFSSSLPEATQRWVINQQLVGRALLFRFDHEGAEWTGAVYGVYQDPADAHQTLGQMAEPLRSAGPWVRRLDSVQRLIARRNTAD